MSNVIKYIDLFSGIGGFRLGLDALGFECVFSSDIDANARSTYEANYGEEPKGDIIKIEPKDIPNHDILCAGFPCQPFSISGLQQGFEDTRGTLFFEILKILKEKKPRVVFLENVKHLVHHDKGNTFRVMLKHLDELGYVVSYKILNAKDFGVAQNRERIIIIGLLNEKNEPFDFKRVKRYERKVVFPSPRGAMGSLIAYLVAIKNDPLHLVFSRCGLKPFISFYHLNVRFSIRRIANGLSPSLPPQSQIIISRLVEPYIHVSYPLGQVDRRPPNELSATYIQSCPFLLQNKIFAHELQMLPKGGRVAISAYYSQYHR